MDRFQTVIQATKVHEGGYVNDPDDPGGETNFGISKRAFPDVDIANLTWDQAMAIYRVNYWDAVRAGSLPVGIDGMVFDMAVNHGVTTAIKYLQKAVGVSVDGVIGPETLKAVERTDPVLLVINFTVARAQQHGRIALGREASAKFLPGWLRRDITEMGVALDTLLGTENDTLKKRVRELEAESNLVLKSVDDIPVLTVPVDQQRNEVQQEIPPMSNSVTKKAAQSDVPTHSSNMTVAAIAALLGAFGYNLDVEVVDKVVVMLGAFGISGGAVVSSLFTRIRARFDD